MAFGVIGKAWQIFRRRGIGAVGETIARRFYGRHRSVWFERRLDETLELIRPRFDGRLDFDHPERVREWITRRKIPGTNDAIEIGSMEERGHLFAGVMNGDDLIGYIKVGWDTVYVLDYGIDMQVPPGYYFIMDIYIDPASRGLGAGPFLVSAAALEMKRRGFAGSIMHVRTNKDPMLKTCQRTGYREIGRVDYRSVLGRPIFRPHPAALIEAMGRRRP